MRPEEISADWDVMTGAMEDMATTFDGAEARPDRTLPMWRSHEHDRVDLQRGVQHGGQNVTEFTTENCKA